MAVWVRLLLGAAYGRRVVEFRGVEVELRAGEMVVSVRELAVASGITYPKTRRILEWMVADGQVVLESDGAKSLVKIVNWGLYQGKFSGAASGAGDDCVSGCNASGWGVKILKAAQAAAQKLTGAAFGAGGGAASGAGVAGVKDCLAACCDDEKNEAAQLPAQAAAQLPAQMGGDLYKVLEGKKEEQSARARERVQGGGGNLADRADLTDQENGNAPGGAKEVDVSLLEWQGLLGDFRKCHPQCAGVPEMAFVAKCRAVCAAPCEVRAAIEEIGMDYAGAAFAASAPPLRVLGWYVERAKKPQKKEGGGGGKVECGRKVFRGYGDEFVEEAAGSDAGEKKNGAAGQASGNGGSHAGS
jgi:hypothetical protein